VCDFLMNGWMDVLIVTTNIGIGIELVNAYWTRLMKDILLE
jgi:hypothetical protein